MDNTQLVETQAGMYHSTWHQWTMPKIQFDSLATSTLHFHMVIICVVLCYFWDIVVFFFHCQQNFVFTWVPFSTMCENLTHLEHIAFPKWVGGRSIARERERELESEDPPISCHCLLQHVRTEYPLSSTLHFSTFNNKSVLCPLLQLQDASTFIPGQIAGVIAEMDLWYR